jgi:predicted lipoprotein with Yx(FWY)xxD motif
VTRISAHPMVNGVRLGLTVAAATVLVAACSSSSKSGAASSATGAATTAAATSAAATSAAPTSAAAKAAGKVVIETHSGKLGTFLTDASGRTLYMFASDSATKSSCSAACDVFWPPLTTTSKATVSGAASAAKITTIAGPAGTKQVVYAGHPLYYFKEDTSAGATNGQGSDGFGAKWWVLNAAGKPITK